MLQSQIILRAIGQSFVEFANKTATAIKHEAKLKNETYESIGRYYWTMRKANDFNITDDAFHDLWENSNILFQPFNKEVTENFKTNNIFIAHQLLIEMLEHFCGTEKETEAFLNGKMDPNNKPLTPLRTILFPFLILLGAYKYLPDSAPNKIKYISLVKFFDETIVSSKDSMHINHFRAFLTTYIETLIDNLESCSDALQTLDKVYHCVEKQISETSYCQHYLLSVFSKPDIKMQQQKNNKPIENKIIKNSFA